MPVHIPSVQELSGVFLLDTEHMAYKGIVGVYLLPGEQGRFSLIETGPASTLPTLKRAITQAGFDLGRLESILLTHIHLDHAGAAGALAKETGARVYVHERGAKHLVNPSRLWESAKRIYQDQMEKLWGSMLPIAQEQVIALKGGEPLEISGHNIRPIPTPGHAAHHLAYFLNGEQLFTGDAAAIRFIGSRVIRPALPPPELDIESYASSIRTMMQLKPKQLLLTHFGLVEDAQEHLEQVLEVNELWARTILEGMQQSEDDLSLQKRIAAYSLRDLSLDHASDDVVERHQVTSSDEMTVMGLKRYWHKHHPELL